MSLPINSDYEVISNAEVSSVINRYTPEMLDLSLSEILKTKGSAITPMANLISSYEMMFKMDIERYPDFSSDISERRTELYMRIIDKICAAHALTCNLPTNIDIYTGSVLIYDFLVSNFQNHVVEFFAKYIQKEASNICAVYKLSDTENSEQANQYAKKRYGAKGADIATIHTHLVEILDVIGGFDISLENIIDVCYGAETPEGVLLKESLVDNGDFFKYVYMPVVSGINRAIMCTNIRLALLPVNSDIYEYIKPEGEV